MRIRDNPWVVGTLLGAAVGAILLGVGGRVAMRIVAWEGGPVNPWTLGGTLTVIGLGTMNGALGGVIRTVAWRWLPAAWPRWAATTLFAAACLALALRGLRPLDSLRLALFLPLVAGYVAITELRFRHASRHWPRGRTLPAESARAA